MRHFQSFVIVNASTVLYLSGKARVPTIHELSLITAELSAEIPLATEESEKRRWMGASLSL